MAKYRLYHNPDCSKSRAALEILSARGVDFEIIRYLESPPGTREEWLRILTAHPVLIQRPLLTDGESAVIGRPPEKILEFLARA